MISKKHPRVIDSLRNISDRWVWSRKQRRRKEWAPHSRILTWSQKFWKARSLSVKISSTWAMDLRKSSRRILETSRWSSQSQVTEAIDVEIDRRTSLARVSGRAPFRARNCKEICKSRPPSPNDNEDKANRAVVN